MPERYTTGYAVLNGCTEPFVLSGWFQKRGERSVSVHVNYTFVDKIDPNFKMRADTVAYWLMRLFVLNIWNGRDYSVRISGTFEREVFY